MSIRIVIEIPDDLIDDTLHDSMTDDRYGDPPRWLQHLVDQAREALREQP